MRQLTPLLVAAVAALCAGCVLQPTEVGKVVDGTGLVRQGETGRWKTAETNSVLLEKDYLATGESMRLQLRVDCNDFLVDENASLYVGDKTGLGVRRICLERGDLFLSVFQSGNQPVRVETAAGNVYCTGGLLFLRAVNREGPRDTGAEAAPEMRINVAVIAGEAVVEHGGLARRVSAGHLCYCETGSPPMEPVETDPSALQETRSWLKQRFASSGMALFNLSRLERKVVKPAAKKDSSGKK
jgi:hypothetical protein